MSLSRNKFTAASLHDLSITGLPSSHSGEWDDLKCSMLEIRALDRVNALSAMVAAALLANLQSAGGPAPTSSVDPDGDVVLTWHDGARKGSAVVAEDKISTVVTNGARVEYVSPQVSAADNGVYKLELFSQGVVKWMQQTKWLSPSSIISVLDDTFLPHTWPQSGLEYKAFTGSRTLTSSSQETEFELNLLSGASTPQLKRP